LQAHCRTCRKRLLQMRIIFNCVCGATPPPAAAPSCPEQGGRNQFFDFTAIFSYDWPRAPPIPGVREKREVLAVCGERVTRLTAMRTLAVVNPKGGCGKSTLAVNIAGYLALRGKRTALADLDPQKSSTDWLAARASGRPTIFQGKLLGKKLFYPLRADFLVMDTPAGIRGKKLADMVSRSDTVVVPILPSPMDIQAAGRFLKVLLSNRRFRQHGGARVCTVINRARENSLNTIRLELMLEKLRLANGARVPLVTVLRATQNYLDAAERGLTIFEWAPAKCCYDQEQWAPLLKWLAI